MGENEKKGQNGVKNGTYIINSAKRERMFLSVQNYILPLQGKTIAEL